MLMTVHMWTDSREGVEFYLILLMLDADPTCTSGCEDVMKYLWVGSDLRCVVILLSSRCSIDLAEGENRRDSRW